ncbi:thioredoxin-disulfide reductase [Candidatus Saccharibacteria bacterium]|nr:thioredoxin-disulfide reductase [Candidatus Saccharibacteria bacterium]
MNDTNTMYDVIIIGAGTAGLTAAIYALRAGKKVLILEEKAYGGQIINAEKVKNYPGFSEISGLQLATNMYEQVKDFGGEIKYEKATGIKVISDSLKEVLTSENKYSAKAVIIATGAANAKLGLAREEELTGKGVSYCATCDGNFFKGKDVAVVGGGNTALQDALYLSNVANKVYLIHRRDEFRAEHIYVEEAKEKPNIEFVLSSNLKELLGDAKVSGIKVENKAGEMREIPVSGVFMAVGYIPQNQAFSDIIELDDKGYIATSDGIHTNVPGIYVAGDARAKELKQLVTAAADGALAADAMIKEIK